MIRSLVVAATVALSVAQSLGAQEAPKARSVTAWLSGGFGRYKAVDPRADYEPQANAAPYGYRAVWLCRRDVCASGRLSRGAELFGGEMARDERALIVAARRRSGGLLATAGAGMTWVHLKNYHMYPGVTDPNSLSRKERGLAIGGEVTAAGSFAGIGAAVLGSATPSSRYAALTVTAQLGLLR